MAAGGGDRKVGWDGTLASTADREAPTAGRRHAEAAKAAPVRGRICFHWRLGMLNASDWEFERRPKCWAAANPALRGAASALWPGIFAPRRAGTATRVHLARPLL